MGRRTSASRKRALSSLRQFGHVGAALSCWLLLIGMWVFLFMGDSSIGSSLFAAGQTIAVMAVAIAVSALLWVRHNLGIFRRKGARRGRPGSLPRTDIDRLGRAVVWEFDRGAREAADVGYVVIDQGASEKRYRYGLRREER